MEDEIAGKNMIEIACGCAEFSICASEKAGTVTCIDLVDQRLLPEIGMRENIKSEKMDATAMKYADDTFDIAVIYNAVGHLESVLPKVLKECLRVVKREGMIYIISSSKMDKYVIHSSLIPYLDDKCIEHTYEADRIFLYVKICV